MELSATVLLERQSISVNSKTQVELEQRWEGIQALKNNVKSTAINDYDMSLVNTAGGDHVE